MTSVLMIGFAEAYVASLDVALPRGSVTVVEEPEVIARRGLHAVAGRHPSMGDVLARPYVDVRALLDSDVGRSRYEAVVPGSEYAVPAAAALADALGLPGAGRAAAAILRDKLRLRRHTSARGIPNPRFREARGADDIQNFAGAGGLVVKPTGRQASLGVQVLRDASEARRAWLAAAHARDPQHLTGLPADSYLVEEYIDGREFSVEAVAAGGEIVFTNVTAKTVLAGRHPVETGHVVPAPLSRARAARLVQLTAQLAAAVGFGTGILHAEWRERDDDFVLIECAGRPPGDRIVDLIDLAYDMRLMPAVVDALRGVRPSLPARPARCAAIGFVIPAAGVVADVRGVEDARRVPGIVDLVVDVTPGAVVAPCRSSWDRCGHALAVGEDPARAAAAVTRALSTLVITNAA